MDMLDSTGGARHARTPQHVHVGTLTPYKQQGMCSKDNAPVVPTLESLRNVLRIADIGDEASTRVMKGFATSLSMIGACLPIICTPLCSCILVSFIFLSWWMTLLAFLYKLHLRVYVQIVASTLLCSMYANNSPCILSVVGVLEDGFNKLADVLVDLFSCSCHGG